MNLMDRRTRKAFRYFAASPSYLNEQIVTPREWKPRPLTEEEIVRRAEQPRVPLTRVQNLAKQFAWFLFKVGICTAVVLALIAAWFAF